MVVEAHMFEYEQVKSFFEEILYHMLGKTQDYDRAVVRGLPVQICEGNQLHNLDIYMDSVHHEILNALLNVLLVKTIPHRPGHKSYTEFTIKLVLYSLWTVSYTHLDVYKRQLR